MKQASKREDFSKILKSFIKSSSYVLKKGHKNLTTEEAIAYVKKMRGLLKALLKDYKTHIRFTFSPNSDWFKWWKTDRLSLKGKISLSKTVKGNFSITLTPGGFPLF